MLVGKQFPKHYVKIKSIGGNQLRSLHLPKSKRPEDLPFVSNTRSMTGEILFLQTNCTLRPGISGQGMLEGFCAMPERPTSHKTLIESLLKEQP